MLSKSCQYAIRALIYITGCPGEHGKVNIESVSSAIGTPKHFTAKLLQALSKRQIIGSAKGPNGGFYIDPKGADIPLSLVVEAIDGPGVLNGCILGLSACSEDHPCPLHHHYKGIRCEMKNMLEQQTIQMMARSMEDGKSFVKNMNHSGHPG
jgi:Rrf2 family protein